MYPTRIMWRKMIAINANQINWGFMKMCIHVWFTRIFQTFISGLHVLYSCLHQYSMMTDFYTEFNMMFFFCTRENRMYQGCKRHSEQRSLCRGWDSVFKRKQWLPEFHSFVCLQAWRTWRPSPAPLAESSSHRRRCSPAPTARREGSPRSRSTHAARR